jgi:hypothetical protein
MNEIISIVLNWFADNVVGLIAPLATVFLIRKTRKCSIVRKLRRDESLDVAIENLKGITEILSGNAALNDAQVDRFRKLILCIKRKHSKGIPRKNKKALKQIQKVLKKSPTEIDKNAFWEDICRLLDDLKIEQEANRLMEY